MNLLWLTRELCESHTQLPKILAHLAIVFIYSMLRRPTPNFCLGVQPLTNIALFILTLQFRRFSQAQIFVWSSCQTRQRGHSIHQSKMPKIRSLLWLLLNKHTHRLTLIHPCIYIHTRINVHYRTTISEVDAIIQVTKKEQTEKEYLRRTRNIPENKL